jgi:hypothetical protein
MELVTEEVPYWLWQVERLMMGTVTRRRSTGRLEPPEVVVPQPATLAEEPEAGSEPAAARVA